MKILIESPSPTCVSRCEAGKLPWETGSFQDASEESGSGPESSPKCHSFLLSLQFSFIHTDVYSLMYNFSGGKIIQYAL